MTAPDTRVVRDRTVLADSDTFELDLKGFPALSAIDIILRVTNGATMNQGVPIHTDVDTIEVVDGTNVIYSLSGVQARVMNCYEQRRYPVVTLDERAAAVQEEVFRVSFGRHVGDQEYWFDPAMYSNPVLRVTFSFTISATAGFATGTGRISIIAHVWDERPGGRAGVFMTKQHHAITSVASGDVHITIPRAVG